MDRNSNLSQSLILTPDFISTRSRFSSAECACHALARKPTPSLCSQTTFVTLLGHMPSISGILEPQCSTLTVLQTNNVALWGYPETPNEDQPAFHSTVHQLYSLAWALMPSLTQPEPRSPDPTPTQLEKNLRTVPALSKGNLPIPLATTLQIMRNLQKRRDQPNSIGLLGETGAI